MTLDRTDFKKEEKKLKKYYNEQQMLEKILVHLKQCSSYEDILNNPISSMYGFEALKHEMTGYYSFNLCKNGGMIRLICSIKKEEKIVKLEYISIRHYEDFKRKIKKDKLKIYE